MITEEQMKEVQDLIVLAAEKKAVAEAAETAFKMVRSDIETLCDELGIAEMTSGDNKLEIKHVNKFKRYKDDQAVLELLPKGVKILDLMSLDRKKINAYFKESGLPDAIKKQERYGESTSIYFKKV